MSTFYTRAACAGIVAFAIPTAVDAAPMKVTATLSGASETPPNGTKGTGVLSGNYDPATKKLTYDVTYSGLTGPATMAHFHAPAPVGKASGVEIPIKGSVESPIKGEATLTDVEAKNLTDGMTYFNVHTAANKAGEIRGQVMVAK